MSDQKKTGLKGLKIRSQLILGFGAVIAVILVTLGVIRLQMSSQNVIMNRTIDLRAPTIQNSIEMQNGMNLSLAGLRGWMLLGNPTFQQDRAQAWEIIDGSVSTMEVLSQNWTDPENVSRFDEIKTVLREFRSTQQEIDDIAQTPENLPATQLLIVDAAPKADIIIGSITEMIDLEIARRGGENRIAILGSMANFRGAMAMSLANVRAYLLSGDEEFVEKYNRFTTVRQRSQRELTAVRASLNPAQRAAFDRLASAVTEFEPLPPRMFEIRGGDQWNLANYQLGTEAAPRAARIVTLVDAMVVSQTELMDADKEAVASSMNATALVMLAAFILSILLAVGIAKTITGLIATPIIALTTSATQLSLGKEMSKPMSVDSGGEVGDLADAMERLRASVVVLTEMTGSGGADEIGDIDAVDGDGAPAGDDDFDF